MGSEELTPVQLEAWQQCRADAIKTGLTTVIVQIRATDYFGDTGFRHRLEKQLDSELKSADLGHCDGGQGGAGTMEVFLYVRTSQLNEALPIIKKGIDSAGVLGISRIDVYDYDEFVFFDSIAV